MPLEVGRGEQAAQLLKKGDVVDGRFVIEKVLGMGGFGAVFEVIDMKSSQRDAMKVEMTQQNFRTLKVEVAVLKTLNEKGARHVCRIIHCDIKDTFCYVVMTLVGPSINSLLRSLYDKFPDGKTKFVLHTCIHVGQLSLEALEDLHKYGFIHRDVKPHNFAIGRAPDYREIYLLDFGLCRKHLKPDGRVLRPRNRVPFKGTIPYASAHSLGEKDQGRRDDVWSWLFMLIRMTVGKLPWHGLEPPKNASAAEQIRIFARNREHYVQHLDELVAGCPKEYDEIASLISALKYDDKPPYQNIFKIFNSLMRRKGYTKNIPLDWEPKGEYHSFTAAAPHHQMLPGQEGRNSE